MANAAILGAHTMQNLQAQVVAKTTLASAAIAIFGVGSSPMEKPPPTYRYVYAFLDRLKYLAVTRS